MSPPRAGASRKNRKRISAGEERNGGRSTPGTARCDPGKGSAETKGYAGTESGESAEEDAGQAGEA
jgi:hypothetical protein